MINERVSARIFGNTGILVLTQVITKVLGTIFAVVAARKLGVESYGLYVFATTIGSIFGLLAAFGFSQLITREVARDEQHTGEALGQVLIIEAVFSTLAVALMVITLIFLGYPADRILIVTVVGVTMLLNAVLNVFAGFFRAHQRMGLEAVTRITASVLNLGLGLPILLAGSGILQLAIAQLVAFVVALLLGLYLLTHHLARPKFSWHWPAYRKLLKLAIPFAVSSILILVYDGAAVIFLSTLKGDEATGLYAGAANFVRVFGLLPASIVGAVLPAMSQFWYTSHSAWTMIYHRSLKYLLILALPISVGLVLVSDLLVDLVLGSAYAGSGMILQLLAWILIIEFLNHGLSNALISIDRENAYLRIVALAVAFSVIFNLLLIPRFGAQGAVMASLTTEGVVLLSQLIVLSRAGLRTPILRIGAKPLLSVAAMGLVLTLVTTPNLLATILLGFVVYFIVLFALRPFDADEMQALSEWWTAAHNKVLQWLGRSPVEAS